MQFWQTFFVILFNRWKCLTFLAFTTTFDFFYISAYFTFWFSVWLAQATWFLTKWFAIYIFETGYWLWKTVGLIPFQFAKQLKYSWVSWLLGPLHPYSYGVQGMLGFNIVGSMLNQLFLIPEWKTIFRGEISSS